MHYRGCYFFYGLNFLIFPAFSSANEAYLLVLKRLNQNLPGSNFSFVTEDDNFVDVSFSNNSLRASSPMVEVDSVALDIRTIDVYPSPSSKIEWYCLKTYYLILLCLNTVTRNNFL